MPTQRHIIVCEGESGRGFLEPMQEFPELRARRAETPPRPSSPPNES